MARKTINTTVDEETIATIERLSSSGRFASKGQVIDAGVAVLDIGAEQAELPQKAYERAGRIEIMVEEVLELVRSMPDPVVMEAPSPAARTGQPGQSGEVSFDPASVPGVQVGGFPCRCEHTGCQGAKFVGRNKYSKMCPGCESEGHRGNRYDCPRCGEFGTGAL